MSSLYNWLVFYIGPIIGVLVVAILTLAGVATWLARRLRRIERSYQALTAGTDGDSLEAVLEDHVRQVREAVNRVKALDASVLELEATSRRHVQRIGFLRFNPFRDAGGDQSFAVTLADDDGNGVVISSLHSRDVTRVYGKPLATWGSVYPLTEEELHAIQQARGEN